MKAKIILFLLISAFALQAQVTKTYRFDEAWIIPDGVTHVIKKAGNNVKGTSSGLEVYDSQVDTVLFIFDDQDSKRKNPYSGYVTAYVKADTATASQGVYGAGDLTIVAKRLKYDWKTATYDLCQTGFCTTADSISVIANGNWMTNHSDNAYQFAKNLNFGPCDGIAFIITNAGDSTNVMIDLAASEDSK